MKTGLEFRPLGAAILGAALCFCPSLYAQGTSNSNNSSNNVSNSSADDYPDRVELEAFGGASLFGKITAGLGEKLVDGGTVGGRVTFNFSRHVGLEVGYDFMINNVRLGTPIAPGLWDFQFGNQIHYPYIGPVFYLRPRGSRVQPYLTAGVGTVFFEPTSKAKQQAQALDVSLLPGENLVGFSGVSGYQTGGLRGEKNFAANYGGGIQFHFSEHLGLRFDARGFWSPNPTFGLSTVNLGGEYIPSGHKLNGLQTTMGLVIYIGKAPVPPPPAPAAPPAPLNAGSITGAEGTLCQNKPITLHSTASDPAGHQLNYAWKLNGAPSGTNSPDFSFTPNNAGDFTVQVAVTDAANPARTVAAGPITLSVQAYTPPQITNIAARPAELSCATDPTGPHTSSLSGQAAGSACGGNLSYKWTVTEGSVTNDTSPNATFDASTLNFEGAQGQTKTVTATLTVTDETGKSASQTTNIAVKCPPRFVRLPDVVFSKNSARVNNCGKRILIDEAAPRVAGGEYDIVLVGHRDTDEAVNVPERGRGRRRAAGHALDEQRTLNAAAVLSGDTGTCANVDPARIKIDWVGTDQTSTPDPGLCGTSSRPAQKERRGSQVTEADKNRRVEVYLVPRNTQAMPPAVKNIKPVPEREMKALGCPK